MMCKRGVCPACGENKPLTRHHILPKRYYNGYGEIILLCRACHNELEKTIPFRPRLTTMKYYKLLNQFLALAHLKQGDRE